jgi:hypothetical protein
VGIIIPIDKKARKIGFFWGMTSNGTLFLAENNALPDGGGGLQ